MLQRCAGSSLDGTVPELQSQGWCWMWQMCHRAHLCHPEMSQCCGREACTTPLMPQHKPRSLLGKCWLAGGPGWQEGVEEAFGVEGRQRECKMDGSGLGGGGTDWGLPCWIWFPPPSFTELLQSTLAKQAEESPLRRLGLCLVWGGDHPLPLWRWPAYSRAAPVWCPVQRGQDPKCS